jgi:protocatechuate 3,4-dioxygenase beta subunit
MDEQLELTRRRLLELGLALPVPFLIGACGGAGSADEKNPSTQATTTLAPTPACDDGDEPTPEQTEGPFFTPDSPERRSLREHGVEGTTLALTGSVLATDCTPIGGALLDFWHADGNGRYDNEGYRLRGHQFADDQGRFRLETIVPGVYSGRTRHIHVKVQARGGPALTTQLYFPGEAGNERDGLFDRALLMAVRSAAGGRAARFDFVLS